MKRPPVDALYKTFPRIGLACFLVCAQITLPGAAQSNGDKSESISKPISKDQLALLGKKKKKSAEEEEPDGTEMMMDEESEETPYVPRSRRVTETPSETPTDTPVQPTQPVQPQQAEAAATSRPPESDSKESVKEGSMTATAIVGKALEAYGGAGALATLENSYQAVGHLLPAGAKSGATYTYRKFRKGEKWRVDLESPVTSAKSAPTVQILAYNGLAGWKSDGTTIEDMSTIRLTQLNDDNERQPSIISKLEKPGYEFELVEKDTFHQVPIYAIKINHEGERPTIVYIDKRNYLVVGTSYGTDSGNSDTARDISVEYSQYRPIGGTMYPFKQSKYINDQLASDLVINSLSTDAVIDNQLFDRLASADKVHLSKQIEIPFEYSHSEIIIKGRINNGHDDLFFLLDTGASQTIIDRRVAAEHYLFKGAPSNMMTAGGQVDVNNCTIGRLELGNLILNSVDARIHTLAPQSKQLGVRIAGIIGTNVIKKCVMRIDYGKPQIVVCDFDKFDRPPAAVAIPLVQHNAPVVKIKTDGGQEVLMLADTGAAFNNLPSGVAKKILKQSGAQTTNITEGTGLDGKKIRLGSLVLKNVTIGTQSVKNASFTYTVDEDKNQKKEDNVAQDNAGFFQNTNLGILGNPFWQNFIVTIDYKFQRILLEPNPIVRIRSQINKELQTGDDKLVIYRDYRAAESAYQRALLLASSSKDLRYEATLWGRLANMRRMMAKELGRPEHAKTAYTNFLKAQELASKSGAKEVEGHILADWSLLYSDNGQAVEARQTINRAILIAPQDAQVNVDYAIHLYKDSQFAQMQKYVEKALFLEPSNWQALWYQYKLAERFFDVPKAVQTLKEIIRYYPWSKLAQEKLKEYQARMVPPAGAGTRPPQGQTPRTNQPVRP